MKVIRAEAMGMCFGVRDALQAIEGITDPHCSTIYGELVHNELVIDQLANNGFSTLSESTRNVVPLTSQVVITAHGISNTERQRLLDSGKKLIDTTCPLVQRVHDTARRLNEQGWFIVIIGQARHVEVIGITGDLRDYAVVSCLDEVTNFGRPRIAVLCQTTTRPQLAEELTLAIRGANCGATVRFVDTICRPTRERQLAAEKLVTQVDALVVVGGKHSNNTRQLVNLAQQRALPVLHVQCAADLDRAWLAHYDTVGITAGTSTLESTIDEVQAAIEAADIHSAA